MITKRYNVYQLKPKVLSEAAILFVKKEMQNVFLKKNATNKSKDSEEWELFLNTFAKVSSNGTVKRYSTYLRDRVIDFKIPGIYISIQSRSKYNLNPDFKTKIKDLAPYLEDTLFFVTSSQVIHRFEIKNGVLNFQETNDYDKWGYDFMGYLVSNYKVHPQTIANFYLDSIIEMKLQFDYLVPHNGDPGEWYIVQEFEDLLNKIEQYQKYVPFEDFKRAKNWLTQRIINYKP